MNAITVENLTKRYRLYDNPSNRLKEIIFKKPLHKPFTALDGITFTVKEGETLGIIGENGAGKSTLLKILAKTLFPSNGELEINGRVSALLELGSGFHPEFTGLDNIYFYGSLLGIDKNLMEKKKRDIIEFSEIGDFINFPLKTYSSGMLVRLAFSVATEINPDILVIDEALSVGDLHFQKKSADRILAFKEYGKTIIFCSHSMYFINKLCDRVIWLKEGRIHMQGEPFRVTQEYETYQMKKETGDNGDIEKVKPEVKRETSLVMIRNIMISPFPAVRCGDNLNIEIDAETSNDSIPYRIAVILKRIDGLDIIGVGTKEIESFKGRKKITLCLPSIQLKEGTFFVDVYAMDDNFVHIFNMKASEPFIIPKESIELGLLNLPHKWLI